MAGDAPGTEHENPARPGGSSPPAPLALYRKYRPATFAEVKGQEHVTDPLRQARRNVAQSQPTPTPTIRPATNPPTVT